MQGPKDNYSPFVWGSGTQGEARARTGVPRSLEPLVPISLKFPSCGRAQRDAGQGGSKGQNVVLALRRHPGGEQQPRTWALLTWLQAPELAEDHRKEFNGREVALISQGLAAEPGFAWQYKAAPAGWEVQRWPSAGRLAGNGGGSEMRGWRLVFPSLQREVEGRSCRWAGKLLLAEGSSIAFGRDLPGSIPFGMEELHEIAGGLEGGRVAARKKALLDPGYQERRESESNHCGGG